jgi:putative ABC transport system permease protein
MIFQHIKQYWRSLKNDRLFTMINLFGLTLGLMSCTIIVLYVINELNYDMQNVKADRIMLLKQYDGSFTTGGKLATDLKERFAQVEKTGRLYQASPLISYQQTAHYETGFYFADSSIFDILTFNISTQNSTSLFKERNTVVISQKMALKYFQNENPVGKEIQFNDKLKCRIVAVMQDIPVNSHIHADFLANYKMANEASGFDVTENYWGGNTLTYLLLAPGTKPAQIQAQLPAYIKQLNDPNAEAVWKLSLIPLKDLYLRTSFLSSTPIRYVYIFSIAGGFILLLACFNYINLATARASSRSKEVGIRKVLGSGIGQLRFQFITETSLFVFFSLVIALLLTSLVLPVINQLTGLSLSIEKIFRIKYIALTSGGLIMVSLLAGLYPAFVLSAYKPIDVFKGQAISGSGKTVLRKILVTTQFAVSMIMIMATTVVFLQLKYVKNKNLGYQREQIITLDLRNASPENKKYFKEQISNIPEVTSSTIAYSLPGSNIMQGQKLVSEFVPNGAKDASIMRLTTDEDYMETFGIRLMEGRLPDPSRPADKQVFLINETAKKYFGWKDIAGKMTGYYTFKYNPDGSYEEIPLKGEVVGVIEDYHHTDLKSQIQPMIISLNDGYEGQMAIKCKKGSIPEAIQSISSAWKNTFTGKPFDYHFLDEQFNASYMQEQKTGRLFGSFAILTVIISCLGLLGLIAFAAEKRKKELGIRKVLGASGLQIFNLLSRDYLIFIGIAALIAIPIAHIFMKRWLDEFSYRISIPLWSYSSTIAIAFCIAILAISIQVIRLAWSNPVKSLRTE